VTGEASTPKMWGGRFAGRLDPTFERFQASLAVDRALVSDDLAGSAAWARALGAAGVLAEGEVGRLVAALAELASELAADSAPLASSSAEDVHGFVEAALAAKVGDLARKLHTGRSRNDQVATDLKLWLRRRLQGVGAALLELQRALVALAERTAELALPGFTHLQRAQPVTAGHHALAYVEMLARDGERFADVARRLERCPLGSGALAGTAWRIEREALARDLGFSAATRNSLDAVSDRDHVLEALFAASVTLVHLSRLAEDWIFFASQEAGYLTLGDEVSTGSSLMPQKKNPDVLELVRGKAGRVIGALTGALVLVKGLPLAYDRDLQEDKQALFDALDTLESCLAVTAIAVRTARYDEARCAAACRRGFLDATDLADLLVAAGVPFRDAHERVGRAVRAALEDGCELTGLSPARRAELLPELRERWEDELSVAAILARRDVVGGTAPARVRAEVQRWKERLEAWNRS